MMPTVTGAVYVQVTNSKLDAWVAANGVPSIILATGFIAKNTLGQVGLPESWPRW
jgi:hypothetical protein